MRQSLRSLLWTLGMLVLAPCFAGDAPSNATAATPEERAYNKALESLHWVRGPTTVDIPGKSKLAIPQDYVFLDTANTDKYLELNQNLASGKDVLVAPAGMQWAAYLSFEDDGYVKDNDKIDAAELLKALQEGTEQSNSERRRRGWPTLRIIDWAVPPAYNSSNKRLEWATLLESEGHRNVNFSTKVLSRRGHTSVILVSSVETLNAARPELETLLGGYSFDAGESYAEWVPGDKVAEYGLAALVLGGAAAIATKKGLWAVLAGFLATGWKFLVAGGVAAAAGLRKFLGRKSRDDAN
ncbi:MAG: DUF2167 domain-containing protein [Steroidobacteraceae bacterium]